MAYQLSPGVQVQEIDLTTIIPSVATSIGAFAGSFSWGPINEINTISNEIELVSRFGKPNSTNYEYWFSAANYLAYSSDLKVVRAANTDAKNATVSGGGVLINNSFVYDTQYSAGANTYGTFAAKYAGEIGNTLKVYVADANTYSNTWTYYGQFTDAPATSDYVASQGGANDEIHIVVVDTLGKFSNGVANTVLEKFAFVSKASDATTLGGATNYYKNVLNQRSNYIWSMSHPEGSNWGTAAANTIFSGLSSAIATQLSSGADGTLADANLISAYDLFANIDTVDISLIVSGPADVTVANHLIENIAEVRKDCVVLLSPEKDDVVNNIGGEETAVVGYRNTLTSSSYAIMDSGWKYQYDKYNDVYRWVPLNADIAGICARTDYERDPWFSPAGLSRGVIKNVIKLAWNPNKANRDALYIKGINPVVTFQGEGTILYGDKTLLTRPSAFDRINVRRLFIVLEKAIAKASRYTLFEFNDRFTRAQFVNMVEPYLRDVQGRRGITDFRVVCDDTNNTPDIIDRNEFVGAIYLKPQRAADFITLQFIATRTGVDFEELVGSV